MRVGGHRRGERPGAAGAGDTTRPNGPARGRARNQLCTDAAGAAEGHGGA